MPTPAATLKLVRQAHLYFGTFIAPAILFFAFTGALQTFSLHETTPGSSYKPPSWIVSLAQLHKKQTLIVTAKKPRPDGGSKSASSKPDKLDKPAKERSVDVVSAAPVTPTAPDAPAAPAPRKKNLLPMKIFFLLVSIGLFGSTLSGIFMAYRYNRSKTVVTGLLFAGIAVPLLLLLF